MNENIVNWIFKIKSAYAVCSCGEICHIDVTIRSDAIMFRAICPECGRVFTVRQDISLIFKVKADLTDMLINTVKNAFKISHEDGE